MKNFISIGTSEEEQAEQIKKWIKDNYLAIVAGIVIGLGGIFGWDFYQNWTHAKNIEAREAFLQGGTSDNQNYNAQNSLIIAKNKAESGDYEGAIKELETIDMDTHRVLKEVQKISLAKLYLEQKRFDEAITLLENNNLGSSKHLLADAYLAQGKTELALETYKIAQQSTQNQDIKAIIDIKINDIK